MTGREHPGPYHYIVCPDCGREVYAHIKCKRCPECQREANRRHDQEARQRKRAGKTREIGSIDLCQRCGKPYEVEGGMQRYCKDCAPVAWAENDRAASREWNQKAYADPAKRQERNALRRQPKPEQERACPECGRLFLPDTKRAVYCSTACADAAGKRQTAEYEAAHRQEINARKGEQRRDKLDAMTEAERRAYQDGINAVARYNYAKRQGIDFDRAGLLTVTEYAAQRAMPRVTVAAQCSAGRLIGAVKLGNKWYIVPGAVIKSGQVKTVCQQCGKEFWSKQGRNAAFCSAACWRAAHAEELREANRQWHRDHKPEKEPRPKLTEEEQREKRRAYNREYKRRQRAALKEQQQTKEGE